MRELEKKGGATRIGRVEYEGRTDQEDVSRRIEAEEVEELGSGKTMRKHPCQLGERERAESGAGTTSDLILM